MILSILQNSVCYNKELRETGRYCAFFSPLPVVYISQVIFVVHFASLSVFSYINGIFGKCLNLFFYPQITICAAVKMVQKQSFDDGEPLEISSKHLKQVVEQNNQILSFSESVLPEDSLQYHYALGANLAEIFEQGS